MDGIFIQLGGVLFLLVLAWITGTYFERRHINDLQQRELSNGQFLVTQIKSFPARIPGEHPPRLIVAETVVASDYLKSFLAKLRGIFGGEIRSFHSLLDRARRESTQRVIEQARASGFNAICNLRLDTADIGGNSRKTGAAMVAIIASATAYHYQPPSS